MAANEIEHIDYRVDPSEYVARAVAVLETLSSIAIDVFDAHKAGLKLEIPAEVEAAYVAKHGQYGAATIRELRGEEINPKSLASHNVKVFMRLEDPEGSAVPGQPPCSTNIAQKGLHSVYSGTTYLGLIIIFISSLLGGIILVSAEFGLEWVLCTVMGAVGATTLALGLHKDEKRAAKPANSVSIES